MDFDFLLRILVFRQKECKLKFAAWVSIEHSKVEKNRWDKKVFRKKMIFRLFFYPLMEKYRCFFEMAEKFV